MAKIHIPRLKIHEGTIDAMAEIADQKGESQSVVWEDAAVLYIKLQGKFHPEEPIEKPPGTTRPRKNKWLNKYKD